MYRCGECGKEHDAEIGATAPDKPIPPENERIHEDGGLHWPDWMPGWMRIICGTLWFVGVFGPLFALLALAFWRSLSGK